MRNYANKLTRVVIIASFCLLGTITGCASSQIHPKPSSPDLDAIKAADRAYVTAWLNNDPELVMATLSDDAVMIPSGLSALEGGEAIRDFWWPVGSPSATVTEFTLQQLEAGGEGEFGFVRGSFTLTFDYDGKSFFNAGNYLSLLRKPPGSMWRITHRIWSDR
jgi:ketosteroid isomerase-like protein